MYTKSPGLKPGLFSFRENNSYDNFITIKKGKYSNEKRNKSSNSRH